MISQWFALSRAGLELRRCWEYVLAQLAPLAELKEEPAIVERLESRRLQL